jgi:hypothetical protein
MIMTDDKHFRSLHYVEVIYMNGSFFLYRRLHFYEPKEAILIYQRTINKFTACKNQNVIISLREENHHLIKCFKNY